MLRKHIQQQHNVLYSDSLVFQMEKVALNLLFLVPNTKEPNNNAIYISVMANNAQIIQ